MIRLVGWGLFWIVVLILLEHHAAGAGTAVRNAFTGLSTFVANI